MRLSVIFLLGLALLLAPIYAAIPDDPLPIGSSLLCAAVFAALLFAIISAARGDRLFSAPPAVAEKAFLVLLGLALLSIPARLITEHGTGYLGPMLRGGELLAANFAAFALARRVAHERIPLYGLVLTAALASAYVCEQGILEDLPFLLKHQTTWRVFSTSTPDYLAGYLVLLLPLTLALFLQMPSLRAVLPMARHAATGFLGLLILTQLAVLVATGSRFALVSLVVALIVFAIALRYATKHGLVLDRTMRGLMVVLGIGLALATLVFARPVFLRLTNPDPNSTAFRIWTWKGALKMADANPVFGTGIGTWSDLYPRYALTGFTRVAHNSYLQMADECGWPALLVLLVVLGALAFSLARGLKVQPAEAPIETPPPGFLPGDNRLLLCGLLAALAGGVVQNLSDSDWYVFFLGLTFWTFAGLAAGIVSPLAAERNIKFPKPILCAVGSIAGLCAVLMGAQGVAAVYALRAQKQTKTDPIGAARTYDIARAWDSLNSDYPSDQGYKVYFTHKISLNGAEAALRSAAALTPNSVNYRKLGNILQTQGRQTDALAAYRSGLRADPNSLVLLLDLARLTPTPQSLDFYRRVSELELTPIGTVRALGESVETRFAIGDTVMGDEAAKTNPKEAASYYARAAQVLERFADLGGSLNQQQQTLSADTPAPHLDAEMGGLYRHVLTAWIALTPPDQQRVLRLRQEKYRQIFDALFAQSSKPGTL